MKTAQANMGMGDARQKRRKTSKRARAYDKREWAFRRKAFFNRNVRFAAAAKGYRLAADVTQAEVAKIYKVTQSTVCCWESGHYSWQGDVKELDDYMKAVRQAAY